MSPSVQYVSRVYILNHQVMLIEPTVQYTSRVVQFIYYKTNTRIDLFNNKTINNKATQHMKIYVRRDLQNIPHVIGISSTAHNLHSKYYLMTIGNYK